MRILNNNHIGKFSQIDLYQSCRITGFLRKYFNLDKITVVFTDLEVQNHLVVPTGCKWQVNVHLISGFSIP